LPAATRRKQVDWIAGLFDSNGTPMVAQKKPGFKRQSPRSPDLTE
jgi:hypothetical protein